MNLRLCNKKVIIHGRGAIQVTCILALDSHVGHWAKALGPIWLSQCQYARSYNNLYYDVASGSEIPPCNKIDQPLVVYRFSQKVITSITTLHK